MADPTEITIGLTKDSTVPEPPVVTPTAEPTAIPSGQGRFSLATAQPVTGKYNFSAAKLVESGEDYDIRNSQRIGVNRTDKLPILNIQNVESGIRLVTQLFHDSGEEKISYLRSKLGDAYDFDTQPGDPNQVILKKKGDKHWGVVDQKGLSVGELIPEALENVDTLAVLTNIPAGIIAGALTAGGVQAVRQLGKKAINPESSFDTGQVVTEGVAGAAGGGLTSVLSKSGKMVVSGVGKGVQKAGGMIDESIDGGMLSKAGQWLDITNTPEFIAKEMGATGQQLNPLKKNILVDKISRLKDEHPEFVDAWKNAWTFKGKFQNLVKLQDEAGETIGAMMDNFKDVQIPLKNIIKSDAFDQLHKAGQTRFVDKGKRTVRVDRKTKLQIVKAKKDFLDDLGTMVFGEGDRSENAIMNLYRKNKLVGTDLAKDLGAKTNDEALIAMIGDKSISMGDAWALRLGRDDVIKYGKMKGQITSKNTADKYTADAVRQAMQDMVAELPDGATLLKNQDLYSDMHAVLSTMATKVGNDASSIWNPLKILPGTINSAPRYAAKLGINLANKMEVRAFLEGVKGGALPLPAGSQMSVLGKQGSAALGQISRATKYNFVSGMLNKDAQAEQLPRNADAFFQNPEYINKLGENVGDPELMNSMVKMFERGDAEGFSNVLSMVAAENSELFESAPYASMVIQDGKPVIMDKYDREQYRQYLTKTLTDPKDRFEAMQMINGRNEMSKQPFQPPKDYLEIPQKKKEAPKSTVSKVSENLKKTNTVDLGDGTTRQDYDY